MSNNILTKILNGVKFKFADDLINIKYRKILSDKQVEILELKELSMNSKYCIKCDVNGTYRITELHIPNLEVYVETRNVILMENKPFDLGCALAGEPVKLRNGLKAYIYAKAPDILKREHPLAGYIVDDRIIDDNWCVNGMYYGDNGMHPLDIVGMWNEE